MSSNKTTSQAVTTLSFEEFWAWLQGHPNCLSQAGTPEVVLHDDDDLHWHFLTEDAETVVVQLIRGKKLFAEMVLFPADVAYVQVERSEGEEHLFECISESENERVASYHFVLSHGYDVEESGTSGRRMH